MNPVIIYAVVILLATSSSCAVRERIPLSVGEFPHESIRCVELNQPSGALVLHEFSNRTEESDLGLARSVPAFSHLYSSRGYVVVFGDNRVYWFNSRLNLIQEYDASDLGFSENYRLAFSGVSIVEDVLSFFVSSFEESGVRINDYLVQVDREGLLVDKKDVGLVTDWAIIRNPTFDGGYAAAVMGDSGLSYLDLEVVQSDEVISMFRYGGREWSYSVRKYDGLGLLYDSGERIVFETNTNLYRFKSQGDAYCIDDVLYYFDEDLSLHVFDLLTGTNLDSYEFSDFIDDTPPRASILGQNQSGQMVAVLSFGLERVLILIDLELARYKELDRFVGSEIGLLKATDGELRGGQTQNIKTTNP